ncbi:FTR1 family protein [Dactylosporangium sp. CA-052675]|uniref:FTR1 family protein n=1 Tax=Dactylosporangium sp. CA-052675 TaxID=3239927 RepID=UPI003D8F2C9F
MVSAVYFAGPLVVATLMAFLSRTGRRDRLPAVGFGLLGAIPASAAAWAAARGRPELFEAIASLAAVAGIAVLILWMRRTVRTLRAEPTGRLEDALGVSGWAVAAIAFLVALSTGASVTSVVGAATAAGLGWAASTATAETDPLRFLAWTGALLIPVAAGLLTHGVHGLQHAGALPGADRVAFDLGADPASWYATLLIGTVGLATRSTVLEAGAWLAFAMVMTAVYFRPAHGAPRPRAHGVVVLAAVAVLASACGTAAPAADAGVVAVTATGTACRRSAEHATAGPRAFDVRNQGAEVTEIYVYAALVNALAEPVSAVPAAVAHR